jgi:hypothetical protein
LRSLQNATINRVFFPYFVFFYFIYFFGSRAVQQRAGTSDGGGALQKKKKKRNQAMDSYCRWPSLTDEQRPPRRVAHVAIDRLDNSEGDKKREGKKSFDWRPSLPFASSLGLAPEQKAARVFRDVACEYPAQSACPSFSCSCPFGRKGREDPCVVAIVSETREKNSKTKNVAAKIECGAHDGQRALLSSAHGRRRERKGPGRSAAGRRRRTVNPPRIRQEEGPAPFLFFKFAWRPPHCSPRSRSRDGARALARGAPDREDRPERKEETRKE